MTTIQKTHTNAILHIYIKKKYDKKNCYTLRGHNTLLRILCKNETCVPLACSPYDPATPRPHKLYIFLQLRDFSKDSK